MNVNAFVYDVLITWSIVTLIYFVRKYLVEKNNKL